jgi:hypothetical protein
MGKEVWRDMDGYGGRYLVSNLGRIKSIKRTITVSIHGHKMLRKVKGGILVNILNGGYYKIGLRKNPKDKRTVATVHRIMAKT